MPEKNAVGRRRSKTPLRLVTVNDSKKLRSVLGQKAKRVSRKKDWEKVPWLYKAMLKILRKARGQAICAPQVGVSLCVVVIETRKTKGRWRVKPSKPLILINPEIIWQSEEMVDGWEGCLSLHASAASCVFRARAQRHQSVTVKFLDLSGQEKEERFEGFLARIAQHEIQHLSGGNFLQSVDLSGNVWEKVKFESL